MPINQVTIELNMYELMVLRMTTRIGIDKLTKTAELFTENKPIFDGINEDLALAQVVLERMDQTFNSNSIYKF